MQNEQVTRPGRDVQLGAQRGKYKPRTKPRKDKGIPRPHCQIPTGPRLRESINTKYITNGIWTGPTGPDLWRINWVAYGCIHQYVKRWTLPKPGNAICECGQPATDLACLDGQYNPYDATKWGYQCHTCNIKISPCLIGYWFKNESLGIQRRSVVCPPGEGWTRGRLKTSRV